MTEAAEEEARRGLAAAAAGASPSVLRPLLAPRLMLAMICKENIGVGFHFTSCVTVQGDSSACGLGYVDINSVSFRGYPKTELSQHNAVCVREQMGHPAHGFLSSH